MIETFVNDWGMGKVQDLLTLEVELKRAGYTLDELRVFVEERRAILAKKEHIRAMAKLCECGSNMMLMPLNTGPRDQTGDNSKSVWYCGGCHFEEFSEKTVGQQIQELSREGE